MVIDVVLQPMSHLPFCFLFQFMFCHHIFFKLVVNCIFYANCYQGCRARVSACVRACVCVCMRACVRASVCAAYTIKGSDHKRKDYSVWYRSQSNWWNCFDMLKGKTSGEREEIEVEGVGAKQNAFLILWHSNESIKTGFLHLKQSDDNFWQLETMP